MSIFSKDVYIRAHEPFVALTTSDVAKIDAAGAKGVDAIRPVSDDETALMREVESGADLEAAIAPDILSRRRKDYILALLLLISVSFGASVGTAAAGNRNGMALPFIFFNVLCIALLCWEGKKIRRKAGL